MPKRSKTAKKLSEIDSQLKLMWAMLDAKGDVDRRATIRLTAALAIGSALIAADMGVFFGFPFNLDQSLSIAGILAILVFEIWFIGVWIPSWIERVRLGQEAEALQRVMQRAAKSGILDPLITESGVSLPFGDQEKG